jgi:formylglycine-generating enzyme required for sulfatase activity
MTEGPCTPLINKNSRSKPEYFGTEFFFDYPVINVSWDQADIYCEWRGGALPTEAQWEKAARWDPATGESRTFPWSSLLLNGDYLNYASQIGDTVKVGSYQRGASALGALDMAGNVSEWVSDWYLDNYYEQSPHDNPTGPDSGQFKVYRGGSYEDPGSELTTTFRRSVGSKTTMPTLGFRCAFEP